MLTTCKQKKKRTLEKIKPRKLSSEMAKSKEGQSSNNATALPVMEKDRDSTSWNEVKREEKKTSEILYDTAEDVRRREKEELLAKRKQAEEERERFVKEMAEKKAAERAEIIKQARRLILYRKPMCRRINRALLVSECLRELDAQVDFQKTVKDMDKERDAVYVNLMKEDVVKYEEEEKRKAEEQLLKIQNYSVALKKQIEENASNARAKEKNELEAERQDQLNMNRHLELIKECEAEELLNKKNKMKQFFKDAIEEKKRFDLQLKREDEYEDRALAIYRSAKARIQKMHKAIVIQEKEEKERKAKLIAEKCSSMVQSRDALLEEKIFKKAVEEQEAIEKEKQDVRKNYANAMQTSMQNFKVEAAAVKEKQIQEGKDLKAWEMMQRFKRDEYDKNVEKERQMREWNKKIEYANILRKHISEKQAEKQEEKVAADAATNMKEIIEKENKKILDYAEDVVKESTGIRPLYPILKAIEECKKEMGLIQTKKIGQEATPKRKQRKRCTCTKPIPEDKICYL